MSAVPNPVSERWLWYTQPYVDAFVLAALGVMAILGGFSMAISAMPAAAQASPYAYQFDFVGLFAGTGLAVVGVLLLSWLQFPVMKIQRRTLLYGGDR